MTDTKTNEFSQKVVTKKGMGVYMPGHMKVEKGALWEGAYKTLVPTPEEEDVFRAIGLDYIEPNAR